MFAECLTHEGFAVWWDASLHSGETFDEVIERNLREAKAVVVLWSPASVSSRWVRAEATLADRRDKLAPAIIQPCDLPIIFELKHAADLSEWTGDTSDPRWQRFVEDVQRLVESEGGHAAADKAAAKPRVPASRNSEGSHPQRSNRQPLRPGSGDVILARRELRHEAPAVEPGAESEAHCLELQQGELSVEQFLIGPSGAKIGRTAPADIVIPDKSVSREHCVIGLANDELLVTDLNSTNGTFIDDVRITRATILPIGSVVRLGQISLRHSIRSASERELHGQRTGRGRLEAGRVAASS